MENATGSGERAVFIFILWDSARTAREAEARALVRAHTTLLKEFEVCWPPDPWVDHLRRFYGFGDAIWEQKRLRNGTGAFRLLVVEDPAPDWTDGTSPFGVPERVDRNIVRLKGRVRRLFPVKHSAHSSVSVRETRQNLAILLGETLEEFLARPDLDGTCRTLFTAPCGSGGWRDEAQFRKVLGACLRTVRLRAGTGAPLEAGGDITDGGELLVASVAAFRVFAGAAKYRRDPSDADWLVRIGDGVRRYTVHEPQDGWYERAWAQACLDGEIATGEGGIEVPPDKVLRRRRRSLRDYIDVSLNPRSFRLRLLTRVGFPSLARVQLRLGGFLKADFCLGEPRVI